MSWGFSLRLSRLTQGDSVRMLLPILTLIPPDNLKYLATCLRDAPTLPGNLFSVPGLSKFNRVLRWKPPPTLRHAQCFTTFNRNRLLLCFLLFDGACANFTASYISVTNKIFIINGVYSPDKKRFRKEENNCRRWILKLKVWILYLYKFFWLKKFSF